MFGGSSFGSTTFAGPDTVEFTRIYVPDKTAVLQLRNSAGEFLHRLDAWFDAGVTEKINEPSAIDFSLPLSHPAVQSNQVVAPNEIWWYDNKHDLQRKFIIQEEEIVVDTQEIYRVVGEDYLVQLAQEVNDVTGSESPMTVGAAIDLILAAQIGTPAITRGYIDPTIAATSIEFTDQSGHTFLSMLNAIRDQGVGGYFRVGLSRKLNWYRFSQAASLEFNMKHNLCGYSERRRSRKVYNKIYVQGAIQGDGSRIACSSPGYRSDSSSISTYGTRPYTIKSSKIKTQAAADAIADSWLDRHANPPVDRTIPVIDTQALKRGSTLTDEDISEAITIGLPIKLRIPTLAPSAEFLDDVITINVTGIRRDLTQFAQLEVTFGEPSVDLFDNLTDELTTLGGDNNDDTDDVVDLIPNNHIDLDDCPPTYDAGQLVKNNSAEDGIDYTIGGSAGALPQRNTANDSVSWLNPGAANQVVITNPDNDAHTHTSGGSANYILSKNATNNGIIWRAEGSGSGGLSVDVQEERIDLQTTTAPALGEVTDDGYYTGFHYFPDGATETDEYRQFPDLIVGNTLGELGNPMRPCFGMIVSGSGEGRLFYTNKTGTIADWHYLNEYGE